MSSGLTSNLDTNYADSIGAELLSIALIGPDAERRKAVAGALAECRGAVVREFSAYPPALDDVPRLLDDAFDVIIIDLDSNPEYALELVESICVKDTATVMVYSAMANQELVVRCMRAGAREYLDPPFDQSTVAEALVRASALLRQRVHPVKKARGRLLVFLGAKGGSGVTTIACNFAIAMAQESPQSTPQSTLLIDLGLPLGDAALNLGIATEYSTDDALMDPARLDSALLHALLVKHDSGVSVLAGPSKVSEVPASIASVEKLVAVARDEFDYVIVDLGSRLDLMDTTLFRDAYRIYLVTQAGISELRNSNRLISRFFSEGDPRLEIVINRFEPGYLGVTEENITRALGLPVRWKIPDDYDATRRMPNTDTPNSIADSPFSRLILEMTSSVTGHPLTQGKNHGLSLRGLGRDFTERTSTPDKPPSSLSAPQALVSATPGNGGAPPVVTWPSPAPIPYGVALSSTQLNATASVNGTFAYTPGEGYVLPVGTHTLWVTFTPASGHMVQSAVSITVSKATPTIKWPMPAVIPCGAALGNLQLNGTASVPGTFVYTPSAGEVLGAGTHTLSLTFTPANDANYTTAHATVSVTVAKAAPVIKWPPPRQINCGAPLSENQLNAAASVPGTFVYTPAAGEVLDAGTHTLSVTFTPADTEKYATAQATVSVTVAKTPLSISWQTPYPITYGTPLSATQLNATASVPGSFVYNPGAGAVLAAGEHTPSVVFTPKDSAEYSPAQAAVSLTVAMAIPVIAWSTPEPITCGVPLSAAQLNATASVPGTFTYTPAAGEVLGSGSHTLSVTFTPADTLNYETARDIVVLTVIEQSPVAITWPAPSAISYGASLSDTQLNATASVPGTFTYTPYAGLVLPPGRHTLSVTFTPEDAERHAPAQATVALVVEELSDVASLLAAGAPAPLLQNAVADHAASARAEWEVVTGGNTHHQKSPRETRTYKGTVYEKGEDGQWHRQQK
jgi:Flp pilus assembly CpaE family ATPase